MTEAEWLAGFHPETVYAFLRYRLSGRKSRLLACAACRSVWEHISDERERVAVGVAEGFADGQATEAQLGAAHNRAGRARTDYTGWNAGRAATHPDPVRAAIQAITVGYCKRGSQFFNSLPLPHRHGEPSRAAWREGRDRELSHLWLLLNDIGPNPQIVPSPDPSWLTSTVRALAESIYAERAFDQLPILADALQDAGCDNPDVLDHCRGPGPHVRGCWVVDLLLGKQ